MSLNPTPTEDQHRSIVLSRTASGTYRCRNQRGGELTMLGDTTDFTPVELLLAALAGCASIDMEFITGKRSAPLRFEVVASGDKHRDDLGNRMINLKLEFDIDFPDGSSGEAARAVLQRSIDQVRDRLCTVSRTVAVESPVAMNRATS